jgi:hypothetical protein
MEALYQLSYSPETESFSDRRTGGKAPNPAK